MNDKKLKEIKEDFSMGKMKIENIKWLIEQAEKVEQLQQENEMFKVTLDESAKAGATMQKKIGQYAEEMQAKAERLERELEEYKLENQSLKGSVDIIERKRQELVKRLVEANEKIERYEKALKDIEQNSFEIFGAVRIAKQALENETI
jgi:chromosome segregation ATPase